MIDLTLEESLNILDRGRFAHISCISDGEPYVTPMSYAMLDGDLCFRTGPGKRTAALQASPRVCVEVTILREGDAWESVVFRGTARFLDDVDSRSRVVQALLHKYDEVPYGSSSPAPLRETLPIVAITPENLTGRASGTGLGMQTRPGRL